MDIKNWNLGGDTQRCIAWLNIGNRQLDPESTGSWIQRSWLRKHNIGHRNTFEILKTMTTDGWLQLKSFWLGSETNSDSPGNQILLSTKRAWIDPKHTAMRGLILSPVSSIQKSKYWNRGHFLKRFSTKTRILTCPPPLSSPSKSADQLANSRTNCKVSFKIM